MASNGRGSAVPLSSNSDEFKRVEYLLRLSCGSGSSPESISEVCIWHFGNPHQAAMYEKRCRGMLCLHAWVDERTLSKENSLEALHSRGFSISSEGVMFETGKLMLPPAEGRAHRMVLCQIGVGKSFVVEGRADERTRALPDGYDSVYLSSSSSAPGINKEYHHEYVLFNSAQVLPMYLVQFFAGPSQRADGGAAPGKGTSLSPGIQELYDRYDFFDPILYVPVSVRDKMVGSHSTGEASQHKLIGIGDAYELALKESQKGDPLLIARQQEIKNQLKAVDEKLRAVNKNSAEIEEKIYQALQDALFELQDRTQEKMNVLLSEEVELRRQLGYINWAETFLAKETDRASQVDFLNAWKCHAQLRSDLVKGRLRTQEAISTVKADLSIRGSVTVECASAGAGPGAEALSGGLPPVLADVRPAGSFFVDASPSPMMMPSSVPSPQLSAASGGIANMSSLSGVSPIFEASSVDVQPADPPSVQASLSEQKPVTSNLSISSRFSSYSLSGEARRRMRMHRLPEELIKEKLRPFKESTILSPADGDSIGITQSLLLCIPLHPNSKSLPSTRLLYASWQKDAERTVAALLDAACREEVGPTVIICKAGGNVFGGYASEQFRSDETSFGDSKTFLFSISHDIKLPFHGRKLLPLPPNIVGDDIPMEAASTTTPSLRAGSDYIQFGVNDLVLRKGFSNCSSDLENSFGVGMRRGSDESKALLGGAQTFAVDEIELYRVS